MSNDRRRGGRPTTASRPRDDRPGGHHRVPAVRPAHDHRRPVRPVRRDPVHRRAVRQLRGDREGRRDPHQHLARPGDVRARRAVPALGAAAAAARQHRPRPRPSRPACPRGRPRAETDSSVTAGPGLRQGCPTAPARARRVATMAAAPGGAPACVHVPGGNSSGSARAPSGRPHRRGARAVRAGGARRRLRDPPRRRRRPRRPAAGAGRRGRGADPQRHPDRRRGAGRGADGSRSSPGPASGWTTSTSPAATARGVMVVNAPTSNIVSAAEHAVALLLAVARNVPAADASLQAGRVEAVEVHRRRARRTRPSAWSGSAGSACWSPSGWPRSASG